MKVAVIGSNGQLGTDLVEVFGAGHEVVQLTHQDIDVAQLQSVREVLGRIRPDVVLNTAAAHHVPKCEEDPVHAYMVNAIGPLNLAKLSQDFGFRVVHYSTDYVFDGSKKRPYVEIDAVNPLNVYGATKSVGEMYVRNYSPKGYVVRISGIYGKVPCRAKGGNFVTTMIRLAREKNEVKVVTDEVLTPTSTADIARNTLVMLEKDVPPGIYHMTAQGECSWFQFAEVIFTVFNFKTPLLETTAASMPSPVKRPFYSVLENENLKKYGADAMPDWKQSIQHYLQETYRK